MNVLITLTNASEYTGPFDLYSNVDNFTTAFDKNISRDMLIAGYVSTYVPSGTSVIRVKSLGVCTNHIDITVFVPTTTTTSTTAAPTTTTTTTAGQITTTTTTTGGGGQTTTTTTTGGGGETTTTTTTTEGPIVTTTTTTTETPVTTTTTTVRPINNATFAFGGESSGDACYNYNNYQPRITLYFYDSLQDGSYLYTSYEGVGNPDFYPAQGWYAKEDGAIYIQNGNTNNNKTACS
jgi:hypothetical protein